jgi:hypothetical protein
MPMTLSGDGTISGLAAGGLPDATVVQADLATGVAGTGPAFSAYQSSATSISNNTATKLLFGTEQFDTNSNFASSTFTPTVAGYYQVNGKAAYSTNSTNSRWVALYKNGSKVADIAWTVGNGTNYAECGGSYLIYMNGTTDYIELYGLQNSGSTLTTDGGVSTYFSASLVRAA